MTIAKQLNDIETKLDKIAAALGIEVDNPAVAAIKGDTTFGQQVIDVVSAHGHLARRCQKPSPRCH